MTLNQPGGDVSWVGKRVLVSGGTGFIGSALVSHLVELKADVSVIARSEPSMSSVDWIKVEHNKPFPRAEVEKFQPQAVVHLATLFKADHDATDIEALIRTNVELGALLLDSVAPLKPVFVNISSYWQHFEGALYSPVSLYAATKQAFLDIAQYYSERGLDFRNLTIHDTYGPNDQRNKIVSQLLQAGVSRQGIDMGPGDQLINLLFLDDVVAAIIQLTQLPAGLEQQTLDFVVRAERSISIRELVQTIEKVIGQDLGARWGARPARPREMTTDWNFGHMLPGWEQRVSLSEGIQSCWQEVSSAS